MNQDAVKVIKTISIDPETDRLIDSKAVEIGLLTGDRPNYSQALRAIVREWEATKEPQ